MASKLQQFLSARKAAKGCETHVSMAGGSYTLSEADEGQLLPLYAQALSTGEAVHLVERPTLHCFQLYMDLDLQEMEELNHGQLLGYVATVQDTVRQVYPACSATDVFFHVFVCSADAKDVPAKNGKPLLVKTGVCNGSGRK
jgi:hypothetical protein